MPPLTWHSLWIRPGASAAETGHEWESFWRKLRMSLTFHLLVHTWPPLLTAQKLRLCLSSTRYKAPRLNVDEVSRLLDRMPHQRGFTFIDKALIKANNEIFTKAGGMRDDKPKVGGLYMNHCSFSFDLFYSLIFTLKLWDERCCKGLGWAKGRGLVLAKGRGLVLAKGRGLILAKGRGLVLAKGRGPRTSQR